MYLELAAQGAPPELIDMTRIVVLRLESMRGGAIVERPSIFHPATWAPSQGAAGSSTTLVVAEEASSDITGIAALPSEASSRIWVESRRAWYQSKASPLKKSPPENTEIIDVTS